MSRFATRFVLIVSIFAGLFFAHYTLSSVYASNCAASDYDCQIAEIQRELDALKPAHETNKQEYENLGRQLSSLRSRIAAISSELDNLQAQIESRQEDLEMTKVVFEEKTGEHYKFLRMYDPLMPFLSSESASEAFVEINLRQRVADSDRKTIEEYVAELAQLSADEASLRANRDNLAAAQRNVDARAKFLAGEIEKVESYISTLSAKQQEVLAAKAGSFIAHVGDSELADDINASIKGFRDSAPAGSFAVFSFGGYTHRKGMSQYGARGRAENGQNYRQILSAYYGREPVSRDTGGTISVAGFGALDFENYYLFGIAEMPSSWHIEALKAQAIAARTYAYRYKTQGSTICTTEACQVFSNSKAANPPAAWRAAVEATRGEIIEDVVTFYSSTTGGYITTMGWDTTDGSGGGGFMDKTYERLGGSPWLYKAWYRQGYSATGPTCAKDRPWLNGTELADIVNAALVLRNRDDNRITPITTSCWGGNPYSHDELRNAAAPYGGISSVSSVVVQQGNGFTNQVVVNGNVTLSGDEFKQAFNLRAPGYLRIPQSGFAFFNIESK